MKKSILLFNLFLSISAYSQTYDFLLHAENSWSFFNSLICVRTSIPPCQYYPTGGSGPYKYYTGADTSINALQYKILYNSNSCIEGYLREDTTFKKVYFVDNQFSPEFVLYDFSLQQGSLFTINFPIASMHPDGDYRVDSIGTIVTLAGNKKILYLNPVNGGYGFSWIEGIGCTEDLMYPYSGSTQFNYIQTCTGVQYISSVFLLCFSHHSMIYFDQCVYQEAMANQPLFFIFDSCSITNYCSDISRISYSEMHISENPASTSLEIYFESPGSRPEQIRLTDNLGKCVRMIGEIDPGERSVVIDVSDLRQGMYLLEGQYDSGVARNKIIVSR